MMSANRFKYDVSFSFAEEDHLFVEEVVGHLKEKGVDYYYYKEKEIDVWGTYLDKHISGVYSRESRLCVIFVSDTYKNKIWTKFEIKHAKRRARSNVNEYILPFKLDSTELSEISPMIKYLSLENYDAASLAEAIYFKVIRHKERDRLIVWWWEELAFIISRKSTRLVLLLLCLLFGAYTLWDRLTPVSVLAQKLYDQSGDTVHGSICGDGSFSKSNGQGACSSHLGILLPKDSIIHDKTIDECHDEASQISWLPE